MQPITGILLKLLAVASFIVMSSLVKHVSDTIPPGQTVFFRSFFAIPVIFVWMYLRKDLSQGLSVVSPKAHVFRGLIGTSAMICGFAGLGMLPLPEVTALGYAAPLITVVLAAIFLHENVGVFRYSAVGLGMLGVFVVLEPRLTFIGQTHLETTAALGAMLILFGALCSAMAQIHVRQMVQVERTASIVFYFSLTSTVVSLFTIPFGWAVPDPLTTAILVVVGLLGGVGQILQTSSYRYAPASVVAPFEYASMVFSILIGYFVFSEIPTPQMLVGAGLIIAAGVIIILREAQLGLERTKARKVKTPVGT